MLIFTESPTWVNSLNWMNGRPLWTTYSVNPRSISVNSAQPYTTSVGGWVGPFDFGLVLSSGVAAPTPNSLNVSFVVSPPGAVIFDPPTVFVQYPSSSFAFRASPQVLGTFDVRLVFSGVDAAIYSFASTADFYVTIVSNIAQFRYYACYHFWGAPTGSQNMFDATQVSI